MLRHQRFSHRSGLTHSLKLGNSLNLGSPLNLYSNQNLQLFSATHDLNKSFVPSQPKHPNKIKRSGLAEIERNNDTVRQIPDQRGNFKVQISPHPLQAAKKTKDQEAFMTKFADLVRPDEQKPHVQLSKGQKRERPYTSLSIRKRISHNFSSFGRYHVVLDLSAKEDFSEPLDPSKVSTSRALMNFSKVYRNSSGDRFKVKREKPYSNHCSMISAQKVVLKQKEKRERKQVEKVGQRVLPPNRKKRWGMAEPVKFRYAEKEEEEYQIDGWQYFE